MTHDPNPIPADFIERSDLVIDVYGAWPRFEGAVMCSTILESHSKLFDEYGDPTLTLDLHWWTGAPEYYPGGPRHYDPKELHHRIKIAFMVEEVRVYTFHCSDTSIDELKIAASGTYPLLSCKGGFELQCTVFGARVLSVSACDEIGEPLTGAESP